MQHPGGRNAQHSQDVGEGSRFGRWTAIADLGTTLREDHTLALCDCGEVRSVSTRSLRRGHSNSCGCMQREQAKHGHARKSQRTPEYEAWHAMVGRCSPKHTSHADYHDRGITVCDRWAHFENFLVDMGAHPGKGYSLDRIDNERGYEPGNCRWATRAQQDRNKRSNRCESVFGVVLCVADAAAKFGLNRNSIGARLHRGYTLEEAVVRGLVLKQQAGEAQS